MPEAVLHLLVQITVLLTFALLAGRWAAQLKMPRVVGDLTAGILLGPTCLGIVAPHLQTWLFAPGSPATDLRIRLCKLALLVFLFVAGLETHLPANREAFKRVLSVSLGGLAVPFLISCTLAVTIPGLFGSDGFRPGFPLFLGTALSISALPVIARVFMDLGLDHSALASTVLSAAALDDLAGWGLFLIFLNKIGSSSAFSMGTFGAFFAGTLMGAWRSTAAAKILRLSTVGLFAPLYFVGIGLQIHLGRDFSPILVAVLLAVACVGKIIGGAAGARFSGWSWRNSLAAGCAMNARGAMEIILATVALEQGLIHPPLHTALVFVALATSLMAGPCLQALRYGSELESTNSSF